MQVTTITTDGSNSLLDGVRTTLNNAESALLCVAFVQSAGVHLLRPHLERLGSSARLLLTTTFGENTAALRRLYDLGVQLAIYNARSGMYHPKIYAAGTISSSSVVIGSANLTGGLASNVEAAILLQGIRDDEPIRRAWDYAEGLWSNTRCRVWSPSDAGEVDDEAFDPALYAALVESVERHGGIFMTLGPTPKPNHVTEITPTGLYIETEASRAKGNQAQLVEAWMFTLAYEYLRTHRWLTNRYLLATDGLNVKRSSAVCAILATLPGVVATFSADEGIVLTWNGG